jgi:hypothetical protein
LILCAFVDRIRVKRDTDQAVIRGRNFGVEQSKPWHAIPGGVHGADAVLVTLGKRRVAKPAGPVLITFGV